MIDTRSAPGDFAAGIDLNATGVTLKNMFVTATWSGTVTVEYDLPLKAIFTSFGLPGNPAVIDDTALTVTWSVPVWTDVTNLAPVYTVNTGTCDIASGTTKNFSSPVTYTVTDGATVNHFVVTVIAGTFLHQDIGTAGDPLTPGSASYDAGTKAYTVTGGGSDIWGNDDHCHFMYPGSTIAGDFRITARVVSQQMTGNPKAGVMIRAGLNSNDANANNVLNGNNGAYLEWREFGGGGSGNVQELGGGPLAPYWVRLLRTSGEIRSFISADGVTWTFTGGHGCGGLGGAVYAGLCVDAGDNTSSTAVFDNVAIDTPGLPALPGSWLQTDLNGGTGDPQYPGSVYYDATSARFDIGGSGSDIWDPVDRAHYMYQPISGDFSLTTHVLSQQNTDGWAKAGIMARANLTSGSPHASVVVTPSNQTTMQARDVQGGGSWGGPNVGGPAPRWLRLVRTGNMFYAYQSPDGTTWNLVTNHPVTMADPIYVGLAVTSHNNGAISDVLFSDVGFDPLILSFNPGVVASKTMLDQSTKTIKSYLPRGTNLTALAPTYTTSLGATGNPLSGTVLDFTTPQTYIVTAGLSTANYTATLSAPEGLIVSTYFFNTAPALLDPITTLMGNTPAATGLQVANIDYHGGNWGVPGNPGGNNFAILWEGWFDVLAAGGHGLYTFGTSSDDGSAVYMDLNRNGSFADSGEYIVNNNYWQGNTGRTGQVLLNMDSVHLVIGFYQGGGGYDMSAGWKKGSFANFGNLNLVNGISGVFFPVDPHPPLPAQILSFSIAGNSGEINQAAKTISVFVPSTTVVTSLKPTYTLTTGTCDKDNGGPTGYDFTAPQVYKVTDGATVNDYTVTVTVLGLPVVTGLNAWYDSSVGVTTAGSTVTGWQDRSGNNNHATVGVGTPVFAASQVNGLPAVQFRGSNLAINHDITPGQEFIVFRSGRYAVDPNNPSHWGNDWGGPIGEVNDESWMLQGGSTQMWDGNPPNAVSVNGVGATRNGNNWFFSNDVNRYMILKVNPVNHNSAFGRIGRPNNSWGNGELDVAEIIVYATPLSAADEDRVGAYLTNKYAITTTYPPQTPSAIMKQFGAADYPGIINQATHTIDWAVPYGSNIANLAPTYTLVYGATCDRASGSVQDFSSPLVYTVTSSDSLVVQQYTVTVRTMSNPALALIGRWAWGQPNLTDISGATPAGTHNGTAVGGNAGLLAYSADVPPIAAFAGLQSLDLTGGGGGNVGVQINNSANTDGASYVNTYDTNMKDHFTVAFWAKGLPGDWSPFVSKRGEDGIGWQIRRFGNEHLGLTERGIENEDCWPSAGYTKLPTDGNWHHYATVWNQALGTRTLYIDGVLSNVVTNSNGERMNQAPGKHLVLGARQQGGGNTDSEAFFPGLLFDVQVYNAALYPNEVATVMTTPAQQPALMTGFTFPGLGDAIISGTNITINVPVTTAVTAMMPTFVISSGASCDKLSGSPQDFTNPVTYSVTNSDSTLTNVYTVTVTKHPVFGLIGRWVAGDATLADISGATPVGTHDGIGGPGIVFSTDVPPGFAGRKSLDLTAGSVAVQIANTATTDGPSYRDTFDGNIRDHFTVAFWAKGLPGDWQPFLTKRGEDGYGWQYRRFNNDKLGLVIRGIDNEDPNPSGGYIPTPVDGQWHHYAAVWNKATGTRTMYLDGVLSNVVYNNAAQDYNLGSIKHLVLGGRERSGGNDGGFESCFQGKLFDVQIYNAALYPSEVLALVTLPTPPEALITSFTFPGLGAATINGLNISITVPNSAPLTLLSPTYTLSTGATCDKASGSAHDFTTPVTYSVTSSDNLVTNVYTVRLNVVAPSVQINVNISDQTDFGFAGPAPDNGLNKVWNSVARAKSGANLQDENGFATTVGFSFVNFNGAGTWGNPPLTLLHGGVFFWSQDNWGEGVGIRTGEINGLSAGSKYDLYIASLWPDNFSHGTFTVNGVDQMIDGQGVSQSAWVENGNYVKFQNVAPDVNGKILVKATGTQKAGNNQPLMLNGFQLIEVSTAQAAEVVSVTVPGAISAVINQGARTIDVSVPKDMSVTNMQLFYTTSLGSAGSPPSGSLRDFSSPKTYAITSNDLSVTNVYTVTVTKYNRDLALIGRWVAGATNLADISGATPPGTHDGIPVGNTASLAYSADVPTGFPGKSLDLSTGDVAVEIANSATGDGASYMNTYDDNIRTHFTVAFWAKGFPNDWSPYVSKQGENGIGWQFRRFGNSNQVGLTARGIDNEDGWAPGGYIPCSNDGIWHHFATVWNQVTGTRTNYVDGVLSDVVSNNNSQKYNLAPNEHMVLGGRQNGWNYFPGKLFDVRIYNAALYPDEVVAIMAAPAAPVRITSFTFPGLGEATISGTTISLVVPFGTPVTALSPTYTLSTGATCDLASGSTHDFSNPVTYTVTNSDHSVTNAYYVSLTQAPNRSGLLIGRWVAGDTNLNDISGAHPPGTHDGIAVGGVAYSTDVPPGFTGLNSLNLMANNAAVRIANSANVDGGTYVNTFDDNIQSHFTLTFWAKGIPGNWNPYVSKRGENGIGWQFRRRDDVSCTFTMRNPDNQDGNSAGVDLRDGDWHHFAGVWDKVSGTRTIYVDGVFCGTTSNNPAQNYNLASAQHLVLGAREQQGNTNCESFYQGKLFDVRIYNAVLYPSEVIATMTAPAKPLITSFTFPGLGAAVISGSNISMRVPFGTALTALAPTYTLSAGATCDKASGSPQDFSSPVTYTATNLSASTTTNVYTVTVTVGPDTSGGAVVETDISTTFPQGDIGYQAVVPVPNILAVPGTTLALSGGAPQDPTGIDNSSSSWATLTDGSVGVLPGAGTGGPGSVIIRDYWVLTYTLPQAYDLTGIDVFTAWGDNGRTQPRVTVSCVSPNGTTLHAINYNPGGVNSAWVHLDLTAGGVTEVQFAFSQQQNGYVGYAELAARGTVTQSDQTITFGPLADKPANAGPFNLVATASSGLPVTFTKVSGPATIVGNQLTLDGTVGTVVVRATQAGDAKHHPAPPVEQSFDVVKADQAITFGPIPGPYMYGDSFDFDLTNSASITSGLPVTYSVLSGPGTMDAGHVITFVGVGNVTVRASQNGDAAYNPAVPVDAVIAVGQAALTITPNNASRKYLAADPVFTATYTGFVGSDTPAVLTTLPSLTTTVLASDPVAAYPGSISAAGAADDNYAISYGAAATLTITKADQTINFGALADKLVTDPDFQVSATASSGQTVTFAVSVPATLIGADTIHLTGLGEVTVTASQAGDSNYNAAPDVQQSFNVLATPQTITFTALANKVYGDAPFPVSATTTSPLAVQYEIVSGPATISGNTVTIIGAGTVTVRASQLGNALYAAAAPVDQPFTVSKAALSITANNATRQYGQANPTFTATYSGFVYADGPDMLATPVSLATAANGTSIPGPYAITPSGATSNDYTITHIDGTLTVTQANQAITFGALVNKTFGDAPFTVSATGGASGNPITFSIFSGPATATGVNGSTITITGAGVVTVRASQAGDVNYSAAPNVDQSFNVAKAAQAITFGALAGKTYGDAPFTVSATGGASGNPVTFSIAGGPATATGVNGSTITITGAGVVIVRASQAGDVNYSAAPNVDQSFNVAKAAQAVTFASLVNKTFGDPPFTVSATGGASGNPVTFSIAGGPATATGVNGSTITITGAGVVTVRASQAGDANYNAAPNVDQSFNVAKAAQAVTFASLVNKTFGDAPFTVSATGGASGNPVTFSIVSGPATATGVNGSTITITGAGVVTVRASQAGDANYNAAPDVDRSFNVAQAAQAITFGALAGKTYGDAPFTVSATGGASGNPVTFSIVSGPATATGVNGSTITITGVGVVTVGASQAGDANHSAAPDVGRSFNVAQAAQAITFGALAGKTYGDAPFTVSATGGASGNPVTFSIVNGPATATGVNGSTITVTGAGAVTVQASQAGDANYSAAPNVAQSFNVAQAAQAITFGALVSKTFGDAPFTVSATGGASGNPVTFSIVSGPATATGVDGSTITLTGGGTVTVQASQAGDANYSAAPDVDQSFTVGKATGTVALSNVSQVYTGTPKPVTATTTPAGLDVNILYAGSATAPSAVGSYAVVATINDADYQGTVNGTLTITKASASVTIAGLSATFDGTAKSATATTVPANLTVDFTYAGSATKPTNAGSYVVVATINDATYQGSATGTLVIAKATPVITWSAPADITAGTALSNTQLNATSATAGTFTYSPAAGAVLPVGSGQTLSATLAPTDANYATTSATVKINVLNAGPVIASPPTATPNPAIVNEAVSFVVGADDADGDALSYAWLFGDGTAGTGATPTHTYATSGTVTVKVTVTDAAGMATSSTMSLTVNAAGGGALPPVAGTDTDGDGFPDSVELAAGTNPNNASDTPTGSPATSSVPLPDAKLKIKLGFGKPGNDSISLAGTLVLPAKAQLGGQKLTLGIGDLAKSFTLDPKGSAKNGGDAVKLTSKASANPSTAKLSVKLSKGTFTDQLKNYGLTNTTIKGKPVDVPIFVIFNGTFYQQLQHQVYSATTAKTGGTSDAK
ncbi:MAG TPA: LamG-like jellyroll fold domain-containing protein [Planctomycetota bacterium]